VDKNNVTVFYVKCTAPYTVRQNHIIIFLKKIVKILRNDICNQQEHEIDGFYKRNVSRSQTV